MATNKKPRKPYKAKPIYLTGSFYPRETITGIKDIINSIGLVVEITLPRGNASDNDMHKIQDLLNWGGMMLFDRAWHKLWPDAEAYNDFKDQSYEALYAFSRIVKRKQSGKSSGYVGTADELNVIRDVCGVFEDLLKEQLEIAPHRTVKQFLAAKQIVDEEHKERDRLGITHGVHELVDKSTKQVLNQRRYRRPE